MGGEDVAYGFLVAGLDGFGEFVGLFVVVHVVGHGVCF